MDEETHRILYRFNFDNGQTKEFEIRLDKRTLDLVPEPAGPLPDWTRLSHCQCPNCPLDANRCERCPVAANLAPVIDFFKDHVSFEEALTEIITETRTFTKRIAVQNGASSLIGIYMVTSKCPILSKLKPMVGTHLPFATLEETTYRVITMYLLGQFFRARKGCRPDWEFKGLAKLYEDVQTVNKSFLGRFTGLQLQDTGLNALVHLNCYARFTSMTLWETGLDEIEQSFDAYLR